jgi:predicted alpha/beta-hydrolase family hydrolase
MELLIDGPPDSKSTFAFAHGAGGPMRTAFMAGVARGLAAEGIRVVRFEFPYMAAKRKAPDREPVLLDAWREVVAELGGGDRVAVGGKSLGGRMASLVADELGVRGLVCLGYPFHPPGNPERLRTRHLATLKTPTLIVQGTRDPFGGQDEVKTYTLSEAIRLVWMLDGDHSFKPRLSSGTTEAENLALAVDEVARFLLSL